MMAICKNRIVIVTGAGSGLGRSYALEFAREGAKILVNDINMENAVQTAADCRALGAEAVANTSDISNFEAAREMVDTAIEVFGGLDVVVNNAGIVRDRMFASMSEKEWDDVIKVHLKGHFCVSRHAVQYWRDLTKKGEKVDARIINTSSGAGLQGSIGQSNYSAAKGGIASLTLVQAEELKRYGVTSIALAPAARTGMTEDVFADMMKPPEDGSFDYFAPENVAPLVVWLGSAHSSNVTGQIFEVAGGKISIGDGWKTTEGMDKGQKWNPVELTDAMAKLMKSTVPAQKVYGA